MPMYDYRCPSGHTFEAYAKMSEEETRCRFPDCPAYAQRIWIPSARIGHAQSWQPVVIFKDAKGNVRFPGNTKDKVPKGFERVELRTLSQVRTFEKEMNRSERERWDRRKIREELTFAHTRKVLRADLVNQMQSFSNYGKDFARLAMKRSDERKRENFDANFRVEVFS